MNNPCSVAHIPDMVGGAKAYHHELLWATMVPRPAFDANDGTQGSFRRILLSVVTALTDLNGKLRVRGG
jgi:hypothetical protein